MNVVVLSSTMQVNKARRLYEYYTPYMGRKNSNAGVRVAEFFSATRLCFNSLCRYIGMFLSFLIWGHRIKKIVFTSR